MICKIKKNRKKVIELYSKIYNLQGKINEIEQEEINVVNKKNKEYLGKCFKDNEFYLKITEISGKLIFCTIVNFENGYVEINNRFLFESYESIFDVGYDEISVKTFDKEVKTKINEFLKKIFSI